MDEDFDFSASDFDRMFDSAARALDYTVPYDDDFDDFDCE